ncbi:MAG TPA: hypothetical protein VI299_10440 [Polyangiales bacterium]
MSEILARPIGELQSRGWLPPALGGFSTVPASRDAQVGRMREVLERDRALAEANPLSAPAEPVHAFEVALTPILTRTVEPAQSNAQVTPASDAPREVSVSVTEDPAPRAPATRPSPARAARPVCSEPIRTRTMAKLLLSQGHPARALSIYEALIAEGACDPVLLAEADALRSLQT